MKVLALGGSIRAVHDNTRLLLHLVSSSRDLSQYCSKVKKLFKKPVGYKITNTEILCGAALMGAKQEGAEIDYIPIACLKEKDIASRIQQADAVILSSPVYFGDRSSVCHKLIQTAFSKNLLKNKLVGAVSVGAKRNGGQETTNVFLLHEAILMGAYVVGNGPPTSQYGGTAQGGDLGTVLKDRWGLETAWATGKRIAQAARVMVTTVDDTSLKARICILIAMDTPDRRLKNAVQNLVASLRFQGTSFTLIDLLDEEIESCLACSICPIPELRKSPESYACIIQEEQDKMREIRECLTHADALVLAGLNVDSEVIDRYQNFTERTRFIRRNDFELTNVPITSFTLEDVGARRNSLFSLKVLTSYLRHNGIICSPIKETWFEGKKIKAATSQFTEFIQRVNTITVRRQHSSGDAISYKAGGDGGYSDIRLDRTQAIRS